MISISNPVQNEEMPAEFDFSGGTRGKFYRSSAKLNLPVDLDEEIPTRLTELANAKGSRTHRDGAIVGTENGGHFEQSRIRSTS